MISFALANFVVLLVLCGVLFVVGLVIRAIGLGMVRKADEQMTEWRHAEMLDAIRGIPDESHRYQERP